MFWRLVRALVFGVLAGGAQVSLAKGADEKAAPVAQAGGFAWVRVASGFEVGDLPVSVDGQVVDHVLLARIDPRNFRFVVLSRAVSPLSVDQWVATLAAALVVNGSYYTPGLTPDTPILSQGEVLGPAGYKARAGAFVAGPGFTGVRDLSGGDWRRVFAGAENGMVSYPLLVAGGAMGVTRPSVRVARRSFVGQDSGGRIVIGTTAGAFFTLPALAGFLVRAKLGLRMALNLDGGPVACQVVSVGGFVRRVEGGGGVGVCTLPIVLAVVAR